MRLKMKKEERYDMLEIEEDVLIDIIKECIAYYVWESEQCFSSFNEEDEEKFEEIIEKFS